MTLGDYYDYENSSLRKWLNTEFYNSAFSETEKSIIKKITRSVTVSISNKSSSQREKKKLTFINNVCLLEADIARHKFPKRFYSFDTNDDTFDTFWVFPSSGKSYSYDLNRSGFAEVCVENHGLKNLNIKRHQFIHL